MKCPVKKLAVRTRTKGAVYVIMVGVGIFSDWDVFVIMNGSSTSNWG